MQHAPPNGLEVSASMIDLVHPEAWIPPYPEVIEDLDDLCKLGPLIWSLGPAASEERLELLWPAGSHLGTFTRYGEGESEGEELGEGMDEGVGMGEDEGVGMDEGEGEGKGEGEGEGEGVGVGVGVDV
eukprot:CAMPEP_0174703094 /NCGR_PEP_ID=MMETSP1094-20130205/7163_1 /TAXON_ID=156173 /ORGANISM="Chrysochromulina brevifilum, Strain UTEX LB 985" /LENGTH=127 /DNA_ID=CAMNT_0015900969 /DNA_START=277 /DNA_END=663 /DNA_ORIENTATION=+